jgi:hypothetical protein
MMAHCRCLQVTKNGHLRAGFAINGMLLPKQVHKFGGTCVSAAERIASAAQLVLKNAENGDRQVTAATHLHLFPHPTSCCRYALQHTGCTRAGAFVALDRHSFKGS